MIRITAPGPIRTRIELPASKSISNRALVIDALGKGNSRLENLSVCDDTQVIFKALSENSTTIDVGAAGTAMRFLAAYYCVTEGEHFLTGTRRLRERPVAGLVEALGELGAEIRYAGNPGYPPLHIRGKKLAGTLLNLGGDVSSQYVSALLMIAPVLDGGLTLRLTGEIISRPYIDLTLKVMETFGADAAWTGENSIRVNPKPYESSCLRVENDWSAASYWFQIAALARDAQIELPGLSADSLQGDRTVAAIFEPLGVGTVYTGEGIRICKTAQTAGKLEYDFTGHPDLAQTLAVTCALKNIPFRFTGLQSLRVKETDRIAALIRELDKLGYMVTGQGDSVLCWDGARKTPLPDPVIDTYEDHRMAMAFAPAALVVPRIGIRHPEVVSKSYPGFWKELARAGFEQDSSVQA